jgi:hypothetical protein
MKRTKNMKSKKSKTALVAAVAMLGAVATMTSATLANDREHGRGHMGAPVIYVTSQGLFYDSIALTMLPDSGPFQKLEPGGPSGLMTEFGPGDQEYVGGRWWLDVNGDGEMDGEDLYFSCPLLGPGRTEA